MSEESNALINNMLVTLGHILNLCEFSLLMGLPKSMKNIER